MSKYDEKAREIAEQQWTAPVGRARLAKIIAAALQAAAEEARADRDRDWVLAMGRALGWDSGFEVPIVAEVEPFKRLFAAIRERG